MEAKGHGSQGSKSAGFTFTACERIVNNGCLFTVSSCLSCQWVTPLLSPAACGSPAEWQEECG